jgi:anti-sigma-K factor RskA
MSDEHAVRGLLPGYALGILEDREKNEVREHVAGCASCRAELASYRDVTGRMAAAVPDRAPPAGLEMRIMQKIAAGQHGASARPVLDARRPAAGSRRGPWPVLTAIAAMCVIALGAGNLLQWEGILAPQAHAPQTRLTTALLSGVGDARNAYGTIVLDPMDNKGVLAVAGLRGLDHGHQYQLWLIKDGQRRSGGVFSPDAEGYGSMLLTVPVDFKDFRSFTVSVEPRGGSAWPTSSPVLAGTL